MQIGASAIPATYPTNGQDWFNYSTASNCLVQAVLRFEQELDIQILREAVRLSVDIEPILGCQFRVADDRPFWQRLEDLDQLDWCPLEVTDKSEEAVNRFLCLAPSTEKGPQIRTRLIRSSGQDCFVIKLNHTCGDGGAIKEYFIFWRKSTTLWLRNDLR